MALLDQIGPVMIGPSSSHTAGACRLALLARHTLGAEPTRARFALHGSFAKTARGHGTDLALVAGSLGYLPDDPRIRRAFEEAEQVRTGEMHAVPRAPAAPRPEAVDAIASSLRDGTLPSASSVNDAAGIPDANRRRKGEWWTSVLMLALVVPATAIAQSEPAPVASPFPPLTAYCCTAMTIICHWMGRGGSAGRPPNS